MIRFFYLLTDFGPQGKRCPSGEAENEDPANPGDLVAMVQGEEEELPL